MAKHSYNYFTALEEMSEYSVKAAEKLTEVLGSYSPVKISSEIKEMHKIEHAADLKKHEMMKHLAREFITPIEREDIIALAQMIDDVTDSIEDILQNLYVFNVLKLRPEACRFADIILQCCKNLKLVMEEFKDFKKSKNIIHGIIEINTLEEVGDDLYLESVRSLYVGCTDSIEVMAWTKTFGTFEKTCDAVEHVANGVESVIMKNS